MGRKANSGVLGVVVLGAILLATAALIDISDVKITGMAGSEGEIGLFAELTPSNITFPNNLTLFTNYNESGPDTGEIVNVTWTDSGVGHNYTLEFSEDGGSTWGFLNFTNKTYYEWNLSGFNESVNYTLRINTTNGTDTSLDESDEHFWIGHCNVSQSGNWTILREVVVCKNREINLSSAQEQSLYINRGSSVYLGNVTVKSPLEMIFSGSEISHIIMDETTILNKFIIYPGMIRLTNTSSDRVSIYIKDVVTNITGLKTNISYTADVIDQQNFTLFLNNSRFNRTIVEFAAQNISAKARMEDSHVSSCRFYSPMNVSVHDSNCTESLIFLISNNTYNENSWTNFSSIPSGTLNGNYIEAENGFFVNFSNVDVPGVNIYSYAENSTVSIDNTTMRLLLAGSDSKVNIKNTTLNVIHLMGYSSTSIFQAEVKYQFNFHESAEVTVENSTIKEIRFVNEEPPGGVNPYDTEVSNPHAIMRGNNINITTKGVLNWTHPNVTRFFPIYVENITGSPEVGANVTVYNASGVDVWNGTTNSSGWAEANVTFNNETYPDMYSITAEGSFGSTYAELTSDTPLIIITSDPVNLTSPLGGFYTNFNESGLATGDVINITWQRSNTGGKDHVLYSEDGGENWTKLFETTTESHYEWNVSKSEGINESSNYTVKIINEQSGMNLTESMSPQFWIGHCNFTGGINWTLYNEVVVCKNRELTLTQEANYTEKIQPSGTKLAFINVTLPEVTDRLHQGNSPSLVYLINSTIWGGIEIATSNNDVMFFINSTLQRLNLKTSAKENITVTLENLTFNTPLNGDLIQRNDSVPRIHFINTTINSNYAVIGSGGGKQFAKSSVFSRCWLSTEGVINLTDVNCTDGTFFLRSPNMEVEIFDLERDKVKDSIVSNSTSGIYEVGMYNTKFTTIQVNPGVNEGENVSVKIRNVSQFVLRTERDANVTVYDSIILAQSRLTSESYSVFNNSNITVSTIKPQFGILMSLNAVAEFQNSTFDGGFVFGSGNPVLKGTVNFSDNSLVFPGGNWSAGTIVTRFFPIKVINATGSPEIGADITVYNASGVDVWNGTTDANGWAEANVSFTNESYGQGNFTLEARGSLGYGELYLLQDTPVIIITDACVNPYENMHVNEDTVLCPGTFYLNDSDANGAIIVNKSNIELECLGTTIVGNDTFLSSGIRIADKKSNSTVKNCRIINYTYGINVKAAYSKIINNTVESCDFFRDFEYGGSSANARIGVGIRAFQDLIEIINNTLIGNGKGILLLESENAFVDGNNITGILDSGIKISAGTVSEIGEYVHSITRNNFVEGGIVYYNHSITNYEFNPSTSPNAGLVICSNCTNVTIRDFLIEDRDYLALFHSNNSLVKNNTIAHATVGFLGSGTRNSIVNNNTFYNLSFGPSHERYSYGTTVVLASGFNFSITNNNITRVNIPLAVSTNAFVHNNLFKTTYSGSQGVGIGRDSVVSNNRFISQPLSDLRLYGGNSSVFNNTFYTSGYGIGISAGDNRIYNNNFTKLGGATIWLFSGYSNGNNHIFNNTIRGYETSNQRGIFLVQGGNGNNFSSNSISVPGASRVVNIEGGVSGTIVEHNSVDLSGTSSVFVFGTNVSGANALVDNNTVFSAGSAPVVKLENASGFVFKRNRFRDGDKCVLVGNLSLNNNLTSNEFNCSTYSINFSESGASDNNIWLNNFYESGVYDSGSNNVYCVNESNLFEGNFYEESLTTFGAGDCGIIDVDVPNSSVNYSGIFNITWRRQSSFLNVSYELFIDGILTATEENSTYSSYEDSTVGGPVTSLLYEFNTSLFADGNHTLKLVPWVNGSRINGTVITQEFNISNAGCIDNDGDGFNQSRVGCGIIFDCDDTNASILPPYENMSINKSTKFCPGTYYFWPNIENRSIIIAEDEVAVDCNNAVMIGIPSGGSLSEDIGIWAYGKNNLELKNCRFSSFTRNIVFDAGSGFAFSNLVLLNSSGAGITLFSAENVTMNNISSYNSSNNGFYLSFSSGVNATSLLSSGNHNGMVLFEVNNFDLSDSLISDNGNFGFLNGDSQNDSLNDIHFYNNRVDMRIYDLGTSGNISMSNITIDNPAGNFENYTVLDLEDDLSSSESYTLSWSGRPSSLPHSLESFEGKLLNISASGPSVSIDSITFRWSDSESALYNESSFQLWVYNGSSDWNLLNSSPDTSNNELGLSNLNPASIYGILEFTDTPPSVILNSPGNNSQIVNQDNVSLNFTAIDNINLTLSCDLYINGILNQTNSSVSNNTPTVFNVNVSEGSYNWSVNCTDGNLNSISEIRSFNVSFIDILISIIGCTPNPASVNNAVTCSADVASYYDIENVSASVNHVNGNDYNQSISCSGTSKEKSCSFIFSNTAVAGTYDYIWYANNSAGNETNASSTFVVQSQPAPPSGGGGGGTPVNLPPTIGEFDREDPSPPEREVVEAEELTPVEQEPQTQPVEEPEVPQVSFTFPWYLKLLPFAITAVLLMLLLFIILGRKRDDVNYLLKYIRKARKHGLTDSEIRKKLTANKWPKVLVDEAFSLLDKK